METSSRDNTGRIVVLETSGVPFFDIDGRLRGYRGISRDITERKRAEDELRKSEAKLKEAQALGRIGSWEFDLDSRTVQWSDQVFRLYERDPAMGPPSVEEEAAYYSPEQAGMLREYAQIAGEQGQAFEYDLEARLPSGRIVYLAATMRPVRDRSGRIIKLFGTVQDITERKRAEVALVQQNDALSKLNHFSIELSMLSTEDNLEALIAKRIKEIAGAVAAIFFVYNPENRTLTAQHIEMEPGLLEKVVSLLGKPVREMHSVVSDKMYRKVTNEIIGMERTLYDVTFGAISRPVGATIKALLKADRFIGVAYLIEGKLYGASLLAMSKGQPDPPKQILENFILLAAMSLRRKRAESQREAALEALGEREKFLSLIIENIPDMIFIKDAKELRFVRFNRAGEMLLGETREDLIGKNDYDFFPREQADFFTRKDREVLESEQLLEILEEPINTKHGMRILHTKKIPIPDKDGKPEFLLGISEDITERKRAEEALWESEERFRTLYENSTIGLYRTTPDGRIHLANPALVRMLGYSSFDDLSIRNLQKNGFEPSYPRTQFIENIEKDGEVKGLESAWERKDGTIIFIRESARAIRDSQAKTLYYDGTVEDITERKRAEEALKKERQRLFSVLDIMPTYAYLQAPDYSVRFTNRKFRELFGDPGDRPCYEAFYGRKKPCDPCITLRVLETGAPQTWEWTSNKDRTYMICVDLFPSEDDENLVLEIGIDITERKRAEEEVRRRAKDLQEKNEELTRFISAVSHDLRSPLVTIQTFEGHLERDIRSRDAARVEKDLGYISNAADKMGRLLDELLRFSRVGRIINPSEEAPLQAIVKEALDLVAGRITERRVRIDLTEEPIVLYGDRARLIEVFLNLVDNAVKFMGDESAPRVEIGVEQAGEEPVLHVRDNGIGIDPELQPMLFDLFHKLDPETEGEGIGLALVKRIVELHGGRIWVESEGLGKGTTFRFTLAKTRRQRAEEEKP
jgi:PAS domain S-box-containing protein